MQNLWRLEDIAVLHYVDEKPWSHRNSEENQQYKEEMDLWWNIYEQKSEAPLQAGAAEPANTKAQLLREMPQLQMAAAAQAFAAREA